MIHIYDFLLNENIIKEVWWFISREFKRRNR
jgi:hypothetical protein